MQSGGQEFKGTVAVIDTNNMTLEKQLVLEIQPYDIAIDPKGYIFITPGTAPWGSAESLSIEIGEKVDISPYPYVRSESLIEKNPAMDKIYLIDPGTLTSRLDQSI